ncbi:unnamed protein product, partial [Nesidiocoris tenuis]
MEVFCVILCVITAGAHPIMSAFGPAWFALPITTLTRIGTRKPPPSPSFRKLIFSSSGPITTKSHSQQYGNPVRDVVSKKGQLHKSTKFSSTPLLDPGSDWDLSRPTTKTYYKCLYRAPGTNSKIPVPKKQLKLKPYLKQKRQLKPKLKRQQSVIQKFRKSFSLRFYKKGGSSSSKDGEEDEPPPVPPDSDLAEVEAGTAASEPEPESPSETPSPQPSTDSPAPTQPKELDNSSQEKF